MRFATALALLLLILAAPAFAADVTGKWKATVGDREQIFTFKAAGATLTGSVTSRGVEMPIGDGKIDGNEISFTVETSDQIRMLYRGVVSGDEIQMTGQTADQNLEMTAKRM